MDITPQIPAGRQVIEAYGENGFRITGRVVEGSVLVFPERTVPWAVQCAEEITFEALAPVLEAVPKVEILLVGCGDRQAMIPERIRDEMRRAKVSVETMSTGAACRTYNVLLAEERRVAAALIAAF